MVWSAVALCRSQCDTLCVSKCKLAALWVVLAAISSWLWVATEEQYSEVSTKAFYTGRVTDPSFGSSDVVVRMQREYFLWLFLAILAKLLTKIQRFEYNLAAADEKEVEEGEEAEGGRSLEMVLA